MFRVVDNAAFYSILMKRKFSYSLQADQLGTSWQYNIEWHNGGKRRRQQVGYEFAAARKNFVMVTSKPRSRDADDLIDVKTWTAVGKIANNELVTVFAKVTFGGKPVVDADVRAQVEVVFVNGSETIKLPAQKMLDDGFGGKK